MTKTTEQKALKFIDEYHLLEKGDKVLVALSGGADSVFLLSFLLKFKNKFKIDLAAFHLNHKLRGSAAAEDEKFCVDFCKKSKVKIIHISKDVRAYAKKLKVSLEEAGREARYNELNKVAKKIGCTKIATAHNSSDNVETILLNFIKGAGLKGVAGIPISRDNIIRPILCLSADEIRRYLTANKIPFRVDESNLDSDYERNFLRNEIIPKLKHKLNPRLEEKISNTSKIISEINSYIDSEIDKLNSRAVTKEKNDIRIKLESVLKLDKSLLRIFFKSVIEKNFNIDLSSENIYNLINLISSQTGNSIHLKNKITAFQERDELVIGERKSGKKSDRSIQIRPGQKAVIDGYVISISEVNRKMFKFTPNKSIEFISAEGLGNVFEIRKWKDGDKFQPIGMKGTKKISDFLSDAKIASIRKRDQSVLTNSGKIVWIIGLRIDEKYKVTPQTEKILKLTLTEK